MDKTRHSIRLSGAIRGPLRIELMFGLILKLAALHFALRKFVSNNQHHPFVSKRINLVRNRTSLVLKSYEFSYGFPFVDRLTRVFTQSEEFRRTRTR